MKLNDLLKVAGLPPNKENPSITDITEDSREVKEGSLFFARRGESFDGNKFIEEAIQKGAVAIITDSAEAAGKRRGVPVIYSKDITGTIANIASAFFGNPSKKLKLIGITGTNGKTTTTYIIFELLNRIGINCGIVGTVETGTWKKRIPSKRTTPGAIEFNRRLKEFLDRGEEYVVCEVSSHGLALRRVENVEFEGAIFTNLSHDHLDFHKNMENYFLAKEKLFFKTRKATVINIDDEYGRLLYSLRGLFRCKTVPVGENGKVKLEGYQLIAEKARFRIVNRQQTVLEVETNLLGRYNAFNITLAITLLQALNLPVEEMVKYLSSIKVPGRMEEVVPGVFVDYAHTPDALAKALTGLKEITSGRLIVVFGCGGNRDREKRTKMGKIADELADIIIVTDDNPRNEDPKTIIQEIVMGIEQNEKLKIIHNREEAIGEALKLKREEDVVLIAGKGHETYQIIGNKKIHFNDREVVRRIHENLSGRAYTDY